MSALLRTHCLLEEFARGTDIVSQAVTFAEYGTGASDESGGSSAHAFRNGLAADVPIHLNGDIHTPVADSIG